MTQYAITFPNDGGFVHRNDFTNPDGSPSFSIQKGPTVDDAFSDVEAANEVAKQLGLSEYELTPVQA